jgi:hypothetical protein
MQCYEELKAQGKPFELVFVSSDKDQESFDEYFGSMVTAAGEQVMALDFAQRQRKSELGKLFEVQGIPTLVLLKLDGTVITKNGTDAVSYGADFLPWDESQMKRGAEQASVKEAAALQAAMDKEAQQAAAQRAAGNVVLQRLVGSPIQTEHDTDAKTVKFNRFASVGAPEALASSGVLYYEFEVSTCVFPLVAPLVLPLVLVIQSVHAPLSLDKEVTVAMLPPNSQTKLVHPLAGRTHCRNTAATSQRADDGRGDARCCPRRASDRWGSRSRTASSRPATKSQKAAGTTRPAGPWTAAASSSGTMSR